MLVQKLGSDDARLDAPEWGPAIKDLLPETEKPNVIVVMLVSLPAPGVSAPGRTRMDASDSSTRTPARAEPKSGGRGLSPCVV